MKVVVRNDKGELKELEVEDQALAARKLLLKLDFMNLSKLPFDILFLICAHLDPEDLIHLKRCCTTLHNFCNNPAIWKDMALREQSKILDASKRQYVAETLRSTDATYIMKTMICHVGAKRIWDTLEAYIGRIEQKSLSPPATEYELLFAEEQLGFRLPPQIHGSWLVHNGQKKIEGSSGFVDGGYPLSLKEMVQMQKEFETNIRTKGLDPNVVQYLNGYRECSEAEAHKVIESTRWVPITGKIGYRQWCTETTTGSIYVFSGWNVIRKGDNWFAFLDSMLD